jgi:hypothetical protein
MIWIKKVRNFFLPVKKVRAEPFIPSQVHDLQEIFKQINHQYFEGALPLSISWYGRKRSSRRIRRKVLGYYDDTKKSIKIHRSLDSSFFPSYFVAFVVYHEMLHYVEPPRQGRQRRMVHHKGFRLREKQFLGYEDAKNFERNHLEKILHGS